MRPDIDIRSYVDTRGATIMMIVSAVAVVAFAALGGLLQPALLPEGTADVEMTVVAVSLPLALILPIIAVVMTAGEWSDRSIQITLLQRPQRARVLLSKMIAALAVTTVTVVVSVLLSMAATWIGGELLGEGAIFSSMEAVLTTQLAVIAATAVFALAMGVLTQSTVLGLVAALGVPFVVSTAASLVMLTGSEVFADVVRAVDLQTAAMELADGQAGLFELIPLTLLVLAPIGLGAWRWMRREVA